MIGFRKIFNTINCFRTTIKFINGNAFKRCKTTKHLDPKCFAIERVKPQDYPEILELFWNSYFKSEPTIIGAGLANKYNSVLENKLITDLAQGLSLLVKCRYDGTIVGVAVNTTISPWDPDHEEALADACLCQKTANLLRFYAHVTRQPNLWCKYCEQKIFEITYLTTRIQDRGKGVAFTLVRKSLDYGKDMTYNLIRIDATSKHSQSICEKLGMKLVYELPYKCYCGPNGKVLIQAPPPHRSVKVYIQLPHSAEEANKKKKKY